MEVGSKLPYQELQFKFDFCHGLLTFHELLPFVQNSFSRLLLAMLSPIKNGVYVLVEVSFYIHIFEWKFVAMFGMKSYRSSSTFVTNDLLFYELLPFVNFFIVFGTFHSSA